LDATWAILERRHRTHYRNLRQVGRLHRITNTSGALEPSSSSKAEVGFRYDATLDGYIFNLSTKELPTGTYQLRFVADADPITQAVRFEVW